MKSRRLSSAAFASALARAFVTLTSLILCAFMTSCVPPLPQNVRDLGTVMDIASDREAEFGTISVSAPMFSDPSDAFAFNLSEGPEDFYADAKNNIQGNASEFQQELSTFGLQASAAFNPTLAAAYSAQLQQYLAAANKPAPAPSTQPTVSSALDQYLITSLSNANQQADPNSKLQLIQQAITDYTALQVANQPSSPSTSKPSFPTAAFPTTAPSYVPTTFPSNFTNSQSGLAFAAFQQLMSSQRTSTITDRTALITAAGDAAVKAMFQIMGNPSLAGKFTDKRILLGVSTVSVNPGWRTGKNYAADVVIAAQYNWQPARPAIISEFIKDPKNPAQLRIRLALDHGMPLPDDRPAMELIFRYCTYLTKDKDDPIRYWDDNIEEFQRHINHQMLLEGLGGPAIPQALSYRPDDAKTPTVAAVSPLTDTQTLDLSSSFRQQEQIAVNLAFAMQMAGLNVNASALLTYAQSLEQDFSTVTPDVVANSYSNGSKYGFQVGPQLRAIENAKAGKYSGPGLVLERQSFPALIVYGFDASDIAPRLMVDGSGKYILLEPQLELSSAHSWLPLNRYWERPSEAQALQLGYWLRRDYQKAKADLEASGLNHYVDVRTNALAGFLFGSDTNQALPQAIISPPRKPGIRNLEPSRVTLPPTGEEKTVSIAIEGTNLDTVELDKLQLVSGGRLIDRGVNAPRRNGDVIWVNVILEPSDDPAPIVFALPSASGGTYTPAIRPFTGSTPEIYGIAPQTVALETDATGSYVSTTVNVFVVGRHLDLIDTRKIYVHGNLSLAVTTRAKSPDILHLQFQTTSPIASLAFALPRIDGGAEVFTPPMTIGSKKLSISLSLNNAGNAYSKTTAAAPAISKVAAPTNVNAHQVNGTDQIQVTWAPSQARSFDIYYRPDSDELAETLIAGVTGTSEIIPGFLAGKTYRFAVSAVDDSGNASSLTTIDNVSVTAPANSQTEGLPSSVAPEMNLTATVSNRQVTLKWTAKADATTYTIDYGKYSDFSAAAALAPAARAALTNPCIAQIDKAVTSETIPNLDNETKYYFVVSAVTAGAKTVLGIVTATPHIVEPAAGKDAGKTTVSANGKDANSNSSAISNNPGRDISKYNDHVSGSVEFSPGATSDEVKAFIAAAATQPSDSKNANKSGGGSATSLEVDTKVTQNPQSSGAGNGSSNKSGQNVQNNNNGQ